MKLRNRLILAFLAATILPLAATVWITTSLLDRSLGYATTGELERLSGTLEATVRQFYQRERDALKQDALAGRVAPAWYPVADEPNWPDAVRAFWEHGEAERFGVSGSEGNQVDYLRRREDGPLDGARGGPALRGVQAYRRDLGAIRLEQLSSQLRQSRQLVASIEARDLRRGFTLTLLLLLGAAWFISLAPLVFIAHRISRPIQQLTEGLTDFAAGDWSRRLETGRDPGTPPRDEVGHAVDAFNRMADQLRQSRERLVHLTQIASWQSLARKTAHEVKNSLTPIRLTVEEMQARLQPADRDLPRSGRPDRRQRDRCARAPGARVLGFFQRAAGQSGSSGRQCGRQRARRACCGRCIPKRRTISGWIRGRRASSRGRTS